MEKVFITKYALTKGILEKEAEIRDYGYEYEIAYVKGEFSSYSSVSYTHLTLPTILRV